MKASELTLGGNTSFLFKGPPGFGKTLAACSFALDGPIFLAYFDKKEPIEILTFFKAINRTDLLDRIEYECYSSQNAHQYLNKLADLAKPGHCRYVAVITDSLTALTSAAVNWSIGFRNAKPKTDKLNSSAMQMKPEMEEYQVETGFVNQAIDICKALPCHIIWTAHPLQGIKMEQSGNTVAVTKTNSLVSVGNKVASGVPGNFTEIYHFTVEKLWDAATGNSVTKRIAVTEAVGDEMAKTALGLPAKLDFTDKLFFEVWRDALKAVK
jgi:hypothetical protein